MTALLLAASLAVAASPQVGMHVVVDVPTRGPVVALLADVTVSSEVVGDVVAVGGSVELKRGAAVHGDVVALGGQVRGVAAVTGRTVALASLAGGAGRPDGPWRVAWGAELVRAGLWVVFGSLLLLLRPAAVRRTGARLVELRWRAALVGVLAVLVWLVVALLALALAATPVGVACVLLAVAAFLVAKLVGITGVSWALGKALSSALPGRWRGELARTGVALVSLAVLSLAPGIGEVAWLTVSVLGIGAWVSDALHRRPIGVLVPTLAAR
ncbi:MAG: hypothetical protein ACHQQS_12570 [Thermoanaerobaculales bacterium]